MDPTGLKEEETKTYSYTPEVKTGFLAAARFVMENSERQTQWLAQQVKENPDLVKEVAKGIEMSFKMQGLALQAGQTYELQDAGVYVPRLSINKLSTNTATTSAEREIIDKFLPNTRFGTLRSKQEIKSIVVHQTGGTTAEGAIETFKKSGSAHYLVDKDGTIIRLMPDLNTAAHVGKPSTWVTNENSIGIEFVGYYDKVPGKSEVLYHDLTPQQQKAGKWLMSSLMVEYNISRENIFRHPQVSAKMKTEAQSVEIP